MGILSKVNNYIHIRQVKKFYKVVSKSRDMLDKYKKNMSERTYSQPVITYYDEEEPKVISDWVDFMSFNYGISPEDVRNSDLYRKLMDIYRREGKISQSMLSHAEHEFLQKKEIPTSDTPSHPEESLSKWAKTTAEGFCRMVATNEEEYKKCVAYHSKKLSEGMKRYLSGMKQGGDEYKQIAELVSRISAETVKEMKQQDIDIWEPPPPGKSPMFDNWVRNTAATYGLDEETVRRSDAAKRYAKKLGIC